MKYYIAADGGGTKLSAILYDENYRILKTARMNGTNETFRSAADIAKEADLLAAELLSVGDIPALERLDTSIVGDNTRLYRALASRVPVREHHVWGEGNTALGAAGLLWGGVAQAGTGSDAFLIQPDETVVIGGYGSLLGDDGSGYDMGLKTLKAAIYAEDGRGPASAILPLLRDRWHIEKTWDLITRLKDDPDSRKTVASATRIAAMAAAQGDAVAEEIFREGGRALALQAKVALEKYGKPMVGSFVISGGAWKGSHVMSDAFIAGVHEKHPDVKITFPLFEPVVGCVVLPYLKAGGDFAVIEPVLKTEFSEYLLQGEEKKDE